MMFKCRNAQAIAEELGKRVRIQRLVKTSPKNSSQRVHTSPPHAIAFPRFSHELCNEGLRAVRRAVEEVLG